MERIYDDLYKITTVWLEDYHWFVQYADYGSSICIITCTVKYGTLIIPIFAISKYRLPIGIMSSVITYHHQWVSLTPWLLSTHWRWLTPWLPLTQWWCHVSFRQKLMLTKWLFIQANNFIIYLINYLCIFLLTYMYVCSYLFLTKKFNYVLYYFVILTYVLN